MICPNCVTPLSEHTDQQARECYIEFLNSLDRLERERYTKMERRYPPLSSPRFRRDSVT